MTGMYRQRPRRMPWPYDLTSMIFNQPTAGSDKIGYVVSTSLLKTAIVATNHLVYYPKYNQRVARSNRHFAHDEDLACVEGDLVHIKLGRKISRYKHYYVFSILEPNIEGRERLKLGLPAVPPPLFGYPTCRRVVKLNLTKPAATRQKLAATVQEHVQDAYRFAGRTGDVSKARTGDTTTFDEAHRLVAPNAEAAAIESDDEAPQIPGFGEVVHDDRTTKGEDYWMNQDPPEKYNFKNFSKSP